MTRPKKIRLGDLLVAEKVISQQQMETALVTQKKSGNKLGRELIAQGFISDDQLVDFLSRQLEIPKLNLHDYEIKREVAEKLPEAHSRRLSGLVLIEQDDSFLVAMADPTDIFAYDEISHILPKRIDIAIAKERDILMALDIVFRRSSEMKGLADELQEDLKANLGNIFQAAVPDPVDTPVAKFLQTMFEDAVQVDASDIHIEPDEKELLIRIRLDGLLHVQAKADTRLVAPLISRLKLMASLDISEKRLPQDGRFQISIKGRRFDVRLSTIPMLYGESAVMRLLDQSRDFSGLEAAGMSDLILHRFRAAINSPHGMVLVTGPTGSGKTTTLYSALKEINKPDTKIVTVEDPVEYRMRGIVQVQVNHKIELTFAKVLRAFLRQDPDVILVGEMRDRETAEMGLRAAMTGHLVLSTLHTNDAVSTAMRLVDMGAEPYLIAASLRGILAQRLIRRTCEKCVAPYQPSEKEWAVLASLWGDQIKALKFNAGKGCTYCHNTGYRGRLAVHEYLEIDEPLMRALQANDFIQFANAARKQPGFKTLRTRALQMAAEGKTTIDEVLRISVAG